LSICEGLAFQRHGKQASSKEIWNFESKAIKLSYNR
jgi:hypothetical protein